MATINLQGHIKFRGRPSNDHLAIVRGLPSARWNPEFQVWSVSLEARDRARLLHGLERMGIDPSPLPAVQDDPIVIEAVKRAQSAGAYPHQLEGVKFLAERDNALLADDMGLGKTFMSINAIPVGGRAIVICPATLKVNWGAEVQKWRSDLTPVICKGRKGFVLPKAGEVVILNYEIIPPQFSPTDKWGEDSDKVTAEERATLSETILIADEAHLCKSHKATRSKRTKVLSNLCAKSWAMTGTPLLSRGFDLWGVVSTFGMGREVFGGFRGFVTRMNAHKNTWGGWDFGTPDPSVPERMRRCMLRRLKSEVLTSLPPKTYQDILVPVGSKRLLKMTEEAYNRLKATPNKLPSFEEFSQVRADLASDRIETLNELVYSFEEAGEPVVVFSAHRAPIDQFIGRDGWKVITGETPASQRDEAVQLFQSGLLKGIACTIKAGGVGLTLTKASKMIFCDLEWNPALNAQAEDRICRIGQEAESLQYIRLVSDCAMDRHVLRLIDKKTRLINASIEAEVEVTTPVTPAPVAPTASTATSVRVKAEREVLEMGDRFWLVKPVPSSEQLKEITQRVAELASNCSNEVDQYKFEVIHNSGLLGANKSVQREAWRLVEKYPN